MKSSIIYNPVAGQWPFRDEVHQTADFLVSNGWDVVSIEETRGPGDATTYAARGGRSRLRCCVRGGR